MGNQEVAAFDPIFWLFHNNWDRLFWEWQKANNATTQEGILSRISGDQASHDAFSDPVAAQLSPFTDVDTKLNAIDLINLHDWDIEYAPSASSPEFHAETLAATTMNTNRSAKTLHAAESFTVDQSMVHIRVEGINRIRIPGSFRVHLLKDGKVIATRPFFQPGNAKECENCVSNSIVHFDFKLPAKEVEGGKLGLEIELTDKNDGETVPIASLGTPSIEVRMPLNKNNR